MATLADRLKAAFRYRVGKYDANAIPGELGIYAQTVAGAAVNESSALAISTVYACTYKIASTLASLNLEIYEKSGRNIRPNITHPAYGLVKDAPNQMMTSYEFWETIISHAVVNGCGYAIIERDGSGYGRRMLIVDYYDVDRMPAESEEGYIYRVRDYGMVQPENMLEICNLQRKSPIRLHRENLGLAKAAQDFGANYFGSDGQMTGILSSDQPLKKEQMDVIQQSWNRASGQAGTKLLPFGFKYSRISISPDEAQFIETRKFQAEEVCRIFSVPPALVQLESQTTYNNVEQQNLMFARHTISPWAKRIEQEIDRKLLMANERPATYSKFNLNDLFRGDMQARATFYREMTQIGALSINEVRMKEEMNPVEGGDTHTVQVNQIALDRLGDYSDKISSNESGQQSPAQG
jgi:HK97 family phage portal protein